MGRNSEGENGKPHQPQCLWPFLLDLKSSSNTFQVFFCVPRSWWHISLLWSPWSSRLLLAPYHRCGNICHPRMVSSPHGSHSVFNTCCPDSGRWVQLPVMPSDGSWVLVIMQKWPRQPSQGSIAQPAERESRDSQSLGVESKEKSVALKGKRGCWRWKQIYVDYLPKCWAKTILQHNHFNIWYFAAWADCGFVRGRIV